MDRPTMNKKTALVLGIPSGIVILGGLLNLILIHVRMENILGGFIKTDPYDLGPNYTNWPDWMIGLCFIIPGYFGLVSALIQNKGLYIASIVITILFLSFMSMVIIFLGLSRDFFYDISPWNNAEDCHDDVRGVCVCGEAVTISRSCSSYKTINSLSVAVNFFLVFTWLSHLVMVVLCCYYTCCAKNGNSQGIVTVITTNQQLPLNQNTSYTSAQNLPPTNLPLWQYSDQTPLITG